MNSESQSELFYWLALNRIKGLGPVAIVKLLNSYHSAQNIFSTASFGNLKSLGLKDEVCKQLVDFNPPSKVQKDIERDLAWLQEPGHHLLTINDRNYPARLREISDPPACLFVQGDPSVLAASQVAMVGSRKASRLGLESALSFARQLSNSGVVVTSGLALGIDAESHRGAMQGAQPTIAILGSGLNKIYPARHRQLARQIVREGGALVSEFPLSAGALPQHFPRRNRIISGLALGTFVVEAEIRSGSLITARLALEQNREVFAMPGSIYNHRTTGCHWLIKQGAKLVENINDVLEEINMLVPVETGTPAKMGFNETEITTGLSADETKVLGYLDIEPTAMDRLVERSKLPITLINSTLVSLELKGIVRAERIGYALIPVGLRR